MATAHLGAAARLTFASLTVPGFSTVTGIGIVTGLGTIASLSLSAVVKEIFGTITGLGLGTITDPGATTDRLELASAKEGASGRYPFW